MAQYVYEYLPSVFSIFLALISGLISGWLRNLVDDIDDSILSSNADKRERQRKLIEWMVLDWATRIGFINSVLAAGVSWFVLFSAAQNPSLGLIEVITGLLLLMVFVIGLFRILQTPAPYLVASTETHIFGLAIRIPPTRLLDFVVVGINFILMTGILYKQISGF